MSIISWVAPTTQRIFPSTQQLSTKPLSLHCAKNERCSFQVAVRHTGDNPLRVSIETSAPSFCKIKTRRVGYVPLPHFNTGTEKKELDGIGKIPGFVPDPLFDETEVLLPSNETHSFWITILPNRLYKTGKTKIKVTVKPENAKPVTQQIELVSYPVKLPKRKNFRMTNWVYVDSLIDWYKTDLFDKRFWEILEKYFRNMVEKGQDTIYVPVFTPSLDGVKRPSQLLNVKKRAGGKYSFQWDDVRRYIRLAKKYGFTHFEICHLFTQWGVKHAIRVYEGQGRNEKLLWNPGTSATSPVYKNFLKQFLPKLRKFLISEKIFDKSFFHLSDEPGGTEAKANYKTARKLLRDVAPWMKVMDALSEIDFAKEDLVDMPVPSIRTAIDFYTAKIPSWYYYCCGPRGKYLQRLMDTPLAKIAMHGFLSYRWPFLGFLHWGYNYWFISQTRILINPFYIQDGRKWPEWAFGDTFVVYPGEEGPIDSIRWEIFGEAMQDYALLQGAGITRDNRLLQKIKSFSDFPKDSKWRGETRRKILAAWAKEN